MNLATPTPIQASNDNLIKFDLKRIDYRKVETYQQWIKFGPSVIAQYGQGITTLASHYSSVCKGGRYNHHTKQVMMWIFWFN